MALDGQLELPGNTGGGSIVSRMALVRPLFHFSEDPTITLFRPHVAALELYILHFQRQTLQYSHPKWVRTVTQIIDTQDATWLPSALKPATIVVFFSPSGRIDPPLSAENGEKDQLETAPLPQNGKRTIYLVVDDDAAILTVVAKILAEYNILNRLFRLRRSLPVTEVQWQRFIFCAGLPDARHVRGRSRHRDDARPP